MDMAKIDKIGKIDGKYTYGKIDEIGKLDAKKKDQIRVKYLIDVSI